MNFKKVDLNLLVVFEAVYSAGNISHAARELGMSQSTVSSALARLRAMTDDPLFVAKRHGAAARRGVEATMKARRMIGPVRKALGIITGQLSGAREIDLASYRRHFRVLLFDALEPFVMPPLLRLIAEQAPGICIESVPGTPHFVEDIRAGRIDLACYVYPVNAPDIVTVPVRSGDLVVIARRDHPAIGKTLDTKTFAALGHVSLVPELRALATIERDMVARQVPRRVVCMVNKTASIAPMVERTDLIGILPRWFAAEIADSFDVTIHEPPVAIAEQFAYMIWHGRSENDPGHRWLRETMLATLRANDAAPAAASDRSSADEAGPRPRRA